MIEFNIKCDNYKEFKFIEKLFYGKGYMWSNTIEISKFETIDYPSIIFNYYLMWIDFVHVDFFDDKTNKVILAKNIIRNKKLNKINDE